ncbi:tyrosine-type recombinase/integrase [Microbacterium sp. F2]|uniref:tyrosine-type recombinase/integrase n=1 Tax=Microbacterium sp. F2 TaxID=3422228 RepID=UPI003FD5E1D7
MVTRARITPAWASALDEFSRRLRPDAVNPTAADIARVTRLRRFALDVGDDPWRVSEAMVTRWLSQLEGSSITVKKYRQALATFYRWSVASGYLIESPVAPRGRSRYELDARWTDALERFRKQQRGARVSAETIDIRVGHVRRFAREVGARPWDVVAEDVAAWIAALDVAPSTRAKMRDSLRAFYRWAAALGLIDSDPTAEPDRRLAARRDLPEVWVEPVRAYRSWLRMSGHPETTVDLRLHQLGRLARDHPSLSPWDVTLDDLIDWMSGKRWSNETRRAQRSALRSFYRWAVDTGRVDDDPSERLPAIRVGVARPRPVLDDEYAAALAKADAGDRLALRMAAELGMRRAEVAVAHSRDLMDATDGAWLLVHGKGARERVIPVPEGLANLIRGTTGYLFPGQSNGHVSPAWLSRRISRLLPEGISMHKLRHRFATVGFNVDQDLFTLQQLLGHASPATTQRYVLVNDEAKRRLVSAVGAL